MEILITFLCVSVGAVFGAQLGCWLALDLPELWHKFKNRKMNKIMRKANIYSKQLKEKQQKRIDEKA